MKTVKTLGMTSPPRAGVSTLVLTLALIGATGTQSAEFTSEEKLANPEVRARIQQGLSEMQIGTFQGASSAKVHYRVLRVPRVDERGVIVISSGRTESVIKYAELIDDLSKQGYSVFIHDHRGQGLSERLPFAREWPELGYVDEFNNYVSDLKTFVDQVVVPNTSGQKRFLLAHSMGGAVAALYLEQYHEHFSAAALSSPMLQLGPELLGREFKCEIVDVKEQWNQLRCPLLKKPQYQEPAFAGNPYTHSQVRLQMVNELFRQYPKARLACPSAHWAAQACSAGREARTRGTQIRLPVLVLQAGDDTIVENAGQRTFCDNINGGDDARCEFIVIPGARHELFIESDEFRTPALKSVLGFSARF